MNTVIVYDDVADTVTHLAGCKRHIRNTTKAAAGRAKARLAAAKAASKNRSGDYRHSSIDWFMGPSGVDGYVALVDPDGGAMAIELGRTGKMGKGGRHDGVKAITGDIW